MIAFFNLRVAQLIFKDVGGQIGVEAAKRLRPRPFALQNPQKVRHLPQRFAEVARRFGLHAAPHTVETFVQKRAQAPTRAVARQAVEIVDVIIAASVRRPFVGGIDFVQPVVGDHLAGGVVDQPRVGVAGVGVGGDTPVVAADIFAHGLIAVHISRAAVNPRFVFALKFVSVAVEHKRAHHFKMAAFEQGALDKVLNFFDRPPLAPDQPGQNRREHRAVGALPHAGESTLDGAFDLVGQKRRFGAVTFENCYQVHRCSYAQSRGRV